MELIQNVSMACQERIQSAEDTSEQLSKNRNCSQMRWSRPGDECIKVDIDADNKKGKMFDGMITRIIMDIVLWASTWVNNPSSAIAVEVETAGLALSIADLQR